MGKPTDFFVPVVESSAHSPTSSKGQKHGMGPSELLEVVVLPTLIQSGLASQSMPRLAQTLARFTAYVEGGHRLWSVGDIAKKHVEGFVYASLPGLVGADSRRSPPCISAVPLSASTSE